MRRTTGGNVLGLALSAALTLAEACAASPPPSPASGASPSPAGVAGAAAGSSPIDWVGMTHAERRDYMQTVVMPKAKELFVAFDPARYEKMSCATCHGDGADGRHVQDAEPDSSRSSRAAPRGSSGSSPRSPPHASSC